MQTRPRRGPRVLPLRAQVRLGCSQSLRARRPDPLHAGGGPGGQAQAKQIETLGELVAKDEAFPATRQIITSAQAEEVIQKADPRFVPILRFMRHMGLRKGEALNLMWSEIEDGWITLSASKTAMGRQPIPMPELCEEILAQLPRTSLYVFPNMDGNPWNPRTLTSIWHDACDAAEVPRCPVYDLRDLFASEMAQRIDKDTLRRLMRHTDTRTTEMHYIHVERERLQRSVNRKYKTDDESSRNA